MLLFFLGCAPRYAASESIQNAVEHSADPAGQHSAEPVDFSEISLLVEDLLSKNEQRDAQDRLYLIQDLIREAQASTPATQHLLKPYIERLLQIEQRELSAYDPLIQLESAPEVEEQGIASSLEPSSVLEMSIEDVEDKDPLTMGSKQKLSDLERQNMISQFNRQIEQGEAVLVLEQISECGDRCWPDPWPVWADARDVYIDTQRRLMEVRLDGLLAEAESSTTIKDIGVLKKETEELIQAYPQAAHIDRLKRLLYKLNQLLEP